MSALRVTSALFLSMLVIATGCGKRSEVASSSTNLPANQDLLANQDEIILTDEDRTEIVRQMLSREITRRREKEPKYGTSSKGNFEIILSTLNIKPELVPKIPDLNFIFLKPDEIEERVTRGGLAYLAFSKFEVQGSKVVVALNSTFRARTAPRSFVSSQSFSYEYRKVDGKWEGKLTSSGQLIS
jgi:hypothetical protein